MDIPESLLCLFNAEVEQRNGSYVIEVPKHELETGVIQGGETYRVGLFPAADIEVENEDEEKTGGFTGQVPGTQLGNTGNNSGSSGSRDEPPVEEGETREVEIEDLGEQGDGIARIGPGYIVFVKNTDIGDRVKIRITDARDNFAFADVVEQL